MYDHEISLSLAEEGFPDVVPPGTKPGVAVVHQARVVKTLNE